MPMTEDHKAALAQGRRESRAIKAYLKALSARKPGRPVTVESVQKRIASLDQRIDSETDPLKQLELHQEKLDAEETLKEVEAKEDIEELEQGFVEVAKSYSDRKGISYTAWRQVGVPASVLKEAGIPRTRKT